jgi:hypothetical protein
MNGEWVVLPKDAHQTLTPLERGHQWSFVLTEGKDGMLSYALSMTRVADEELIGMSYYREPDVMKMNYDLILTESEWNRLKKKAEKHGVVIIDASVNLEKVAFRHQEALDAHRDLEAIFTEAETCLSSESFESFDALLLKARRLTMTYNMSRSAVASAYEALLKEPQRTEDKVTLASWLLPESTHVQGLLALQKAFIASREASLSTQGRLLTLIVGLGNSYYGGILFSTENDALIIHGVSGHAVQVTPKGFTRYA